MSGNLNVMNYFRAC